MPPEKVEPDEARDDGQGEQEGQGRGAGPAESRAPRTRRRRPPVGGETKGRKLHLPDAIHDRLWLMARQRKTTVSAVAADILDKNLPRFRVERDA
jgi:hypothetical protein